MRLDWLAVPQETPLHKLEAIYAWAMLVKVRENIHTGWGHGIIRDTYNSIVTLEDGIYNSLQIKGTPSLTVVAYGYTISMEVTYCGLPGYDGCEKPCLVLSGTTRQREGSRLLQVVFAFWRDGLRWRPYVGSPTEQMLVMTREFTPGSATPTGREFMQLFAQELAMRS